MRSASSGDSNIGFEKPAKSWQIKGKNQVDKQEYQKDLSPVFFFAPSAFSVLGFFAALLLSFFNKQ
jgi:hypothetical protein